MMKETLAVSTTVKGAVQQGAIALGCEVSEVKYDVLEEPKRKGFLGLGGTSLAKVRVYFEREDTPEEAAAKAAAIAAQEQKAAEKAARQAAMGDRGRSDRPRSDRPRGDRPVGERSRSDRPRSERPAGDRPVGERTERPVRAPRPKMDEVDYSGMPELPEEPQRPKIPADPSNPALKLVQTLLTNLGIEAAVYLDPTPDGSGAQHLDVEGEAASVLIGHHGDTLDALQYLSNLALNCGKDDETAPKVKVDIESYRTRREATLRRLAYRKAQQVLKLQKDMTLEPMNPYERRIIHSFVQGIPGVSTHSIGAGAARRVVITFGEEAPAADPQASEDTQE